MSPSVSPPKLLPGPEMSDLAMTAAPPTVTCSRFRRDMPAGLPYTVLASSAEDERPAKPVPMLLMLCSFSAKPAASSWLEASATATPREALSITFFIIRKLLGISGAKSYQQITRRAIAWIAGDRAVL
ncbi:hypothetical protein D9M71_687430 [compost metagenome]